MGHNVLVFESDIEFAREVHSELSRLGCEVTIVDDVNAGLAKAAEQKPDLILLAVELPRMNGFSICNKVKKDPELKDIPLIITSREANAETFESHKKLRWRAEDYLHKPISMDVLIEHVSKFLAFDVSPSSEAQSVEMQDEMVVAQHDEYATEAVDVSMEADVADVSMDAEIGEVELTAVGMTENSRAASPGAPHMEQMEMHPGPVPEPVEETAVSPLPGRGKSGRPRRNSHAPKSPSIPMMAPMNDARVETLESELRDTRHSYESRMSEMEQNHRSEMSRVQVELEEMRAKASNAPSVKPQAGVSGKEFLELRETLNKKDKEMLALRETMSKKDKEMIEVRDRSLDFERKLASLDDRMLETEKELSEAKDKHHTISLDKEQAKKVNEDLKARLARVQGDLESRMGDLSHVKAEHAKVIEELNQKHVAELETSRVDHESEADQLAEHNGRATEAMRNEHKSALEAAVREGTQSAAQQISQLRSDLTQSHENAMAEARQSHDQATAEARSSHEQAMAEARSSHEQAMSVVRASNEETVAEAASLHEKAIADLRQEHEQATSSLREAMDAAHEAKMRTAEQTFDNRTTAMDLAAAEALKAVEDARDARYAALEQKIMEDSSALEVALQKSTELEGKISDMVDTIATMKSNNEAMSEDLANARAHVTQLEDNLAGTKNELQSTRDSLSLESSAHQRAVAKWDQDKVSLSRAKDALAVVLAQIEETETRPLQ